MNSFGGLEFGIICGVTSSLGDSWCLTVQSRFPLLGDLEPGLVLRGFRRALSPWRGEIRAATTELAGHLQAPSIPARTVRKSSFIYWCFYEDEGRSTCFWALHIRHTHRVRAVLNADYEVCWCVCVCDGASGSDSWFSW